MRTLLALLLMVWEPVTLAMTFAGLLDRTVNRGAAAAVLLAVRVVVAGAGIAAGLALWSNRPGGIVLARAAMLLALGASLLTWWTHLWPHRLPPGLEGLALGALMAYYGFWLIWLFRQNWGRDEFQK